jgi:hypothetical protein
MLLSVSERVSVEYEASEGIFANTCPFEQFPHFTADVIAFGPASFETTVKATVNEAKAIDLEAAAPFRVWPGLPIMVAANGVECMPTAAATPDLWDI